MSTPTLEEKPTASKNSAFVLPLPILGSWQRKTMYELPLLNGSRMVLMQNSDDVRVPNGKKGKDSIVIPGKGEVVTAITRKIFNLFTHSGLVENHHHDLSRLPESYLSQLFSRSGAAPEIPALRGPLRDMLNRKDVFMAVPLKMMPYKISVRRGVTKAYRVRYPNRKVGEFLPYPVVEVFKKDKYSERIVILDTLDQRMLFYNPDQDFRVGLHHEERYENAGELLTTLVHGAKLAKRAFAILESLFAKTNYRLVDLQIEVGFTPNHSLFIGDVVTPEEFHVWYGGNPNRHRDEEELARFVDKDIDPSDSSDILRSFQEILFLTDDMML